MQTTRRQFIQQLGFASTGIALGAHIPLIRLQNQN